VITEAMTVNQLSQKEGIDPEKIIKYNNIDSPSSILKKGEKIILR
jgi:LysM repeat protein